MTSIKNILTVCFLIIFTYLFIYPAILFSILILGFTTFWNSGISMLSAAILLRIMVYWYANDRRNKRRSSSGFDSTWISAKAPPPLNEIDDEVILSQREEDLLWAAIQEYSPRDCDDDNYKIRCNCCKEAMIRNK